VAQRAAHVRIDEEAIPTYAASLRAEPPGQPDPEAHLLAGDREALAAFWLTLDAINFGSGWFPTLRKREGRSGYLTIAAGLTERFVAHGPWTPEELMRIDAGMIAEALGQDPAHELMELFARSLNDLGRHVQDGFSTPIDAAGGSAVAFVTELASWSCFADASSFDGIELAFLKRAQLAAADLARSDVAEFHDLDRLTMFADNLVPHVLRLDGILSFDQDLVARIERGELIEHDSPEEIEIRACALHAVELIVAAGPDTKAIDIDQALWRRGQQPRYKASQRHRSRCTAY
jgi:Queuosine salvage protein